MTGTTPPSGTTNQSSQPEAIQASARGANGQLLADLRQDEGQGRWRDSLRDWTLAAIFATAIALGGRYLNGLLDGFSPEGTSWL
ncbi:hypothetical protein ACTL6U_04755 [Rhodovibrionaceae bacterium A322]